MAKNRNLNISSWIVVLCNGIYSCELCSGVLQILLFALVGLLRYPSLKKEDTYGFHQASLPFRGL